MRWLRIVMPVLDEGATLLNRLRQLQALRHRGAELVVVDGGSTDDTWAIACAHADQVLLAPRGRASQMNAGARGSDAQVLLFLHADTVLPADADTLVRSALGRGNRWGYFDLRIDGRHPMLRLVERMVNLRSRLTGIATGDQAMFASRQHFEQAGGFADQPLMEDIDLSVRLKRFGPPACIGTPVITSGRRWESKGVWRTISLMWQLRARYFMGADPQQLASRYGYQPCPATAPAAVAILAKAPIPGLAKTRLIPALGAAGAARAQRRFTIAAVHSAKRFQLGAVTLWCAPDPSHRFFRALHAATGVPLLSQAAGDLGDRMRRAVAHHFATPYALPLLLIGTDCAVLAPGHLQQAARALTDHDVVLIPAEDGGYVLIGMRRPVLEAFAGVAWSTPAVLAQTADRLRHAGASWLELDPLWDVDEPHDWSRLRHLLDTLEPTP